MCLVAGGGLERRGRFLFSLLELISAEWVNAAQTKAKGGLCTSSSSLGICCRMEWNFKNPLHWDWENLGLFGEKESEISKSTEQSEWKAEGGAISNGSLYSSGSVTCSGSDLGDGSSRKPVTASIGFLSKAGNKTHEVNLEVEEGILENQIMNYEMAQGDGRRTSPAIVGCVSNGEPPIGLKLGKRTYFENLGSANTKPSSVSLTPPANSIKRSRASHQSIQHTCCQVEGCNIDLTAAKDYHRKHRVCERHSKSPRVIVVGQERRFCQQCSRFHDLSEFDQKKRSCRRRLSDHNARRRKEQPETISFNPSRLHQVFYADERQQMNFFLNLALFSHLRPTSSLLDQPDGFSLSMAKGSWLKTTKEDVDGQSHLPVMDFSNTATSRDDFNRLMPFKCTLNEVLNQGQEVYVPSSNLNGAPDLRRALSLLSSDAWCPSSTTQTDTIPTASAEPITASLLQVQAANSAHECCWQDDNSLSEQPLPFNLHGDGSHIQDLQLSKAPYETFFEANQVFSKSDAHFLEFKT